MDSSRIESKGRFPPLRCQANRESPRAAVSRFLVDTQLLLWSASGSRKLPAAVGRLFRDGRHEFHFSAASLWEVAIKASLGRPDFTVKAGDLHEVLIGNGFHDFRSPPAMPSPHPGCPRFMPIPSIACSLRKRTRSPWC